MCGYSAGNCMTESKIRTSHLHLVCAENAWRTPDDLSGHPMLDVHAGALIGEEFGTRHDKGNSNDALRLIGANESMELAAKKAEQLSTGDKAKGDSAQMIYDFQTIVAGSQFWGTVWLRDLTDLELAAIATSFHYASVCRRASRTVMHVGAKSSVGYGAISVELRGAVRVSAAEYAPTEALVGKDTADRVGLYREHLRDNRDEILRAIKDSA